MPNICLVNGLLLVQGEHGVIAFSRIFNVAGEWIATLKKDGIVGNNEVYDEEGSISWDLRNYEGLKVASGLYLYQLEGELLGKTVYKEGKIAIVLGP